MPGPLQWKHMLSPILHFQSSSQLELPAPVVPSGTPWCWRLRGPELTVMVPSCPWHQSSVTVGMQLESLW